MFIGIILETGLLSLVRFLVLSLSFIHLSIKLSFLHIKVVQWPSRVQLFLTPWIIACQASLSLTISQSLLKFMSIASVMQSNHLILCCILLFLPSIFPSSSIFSNEQAVHIRWTKYCSYCFSISFLNEYSGLISFKTDWFVLLVVQGTLSQKSSPVPWLEGINSSVHVLLYGPAFTTICDHWKDH